MSPTRDQTHPLIAEAQNPNHWITREVPLFENLSVGLTLNFMAIVYYQICAYFIGKVCLQ